MDGTEDELICEDSKTADDPESANTVLVMMPRTPALPIAMSTKQLGSFLNLRTIKYII